MNSENENDPMLGVRVLLLLILGVLVVGLVYFVLHRRTPTYVASSEEYRASIDQSGMMQANARREGRGLGELAKIIEAGLPEERVRSKAKEEARKVYADMPTLRDEFAAGYVDGYFGR